MGEDIPPRIILLVDVRTAYGRGVLRGVADFVSHHRPWLMFLEAAGKLMPDTGGWPVSGLIAGFPHFSPKHLGPIIKLREQGVPVVALTPFHQEEFTASVQPDHEAVGRIAAEDLMARGHHHYAFCGKPGDPDADRRQAGYAEALKAAGHACHWFEPSESLRQRWNWRSEQAELVQWLGQLPKPVGVMTFSDRRARQVLDACLMARLRVPEQVAVIGAGNDEILCNLANPPISSVDLAAQQVGREAARRLDALMQGETPQPRHLCIRPTGLVTRTSSDILAMDDELVVKAVRYIREHAHEGIGVGDVVDAVGGSRRLLERRFREALDRTIHDEIAERRLERIKHLLATTDMPMRELAKRMGFRESKRLSEFFRSHTGQSPRIYRRSLTE